jgi:hypothetical protein
MYAELQQRMRLPEGMLTGEVVSPSAVLPEYPIIAMYQSTAHPTVGPEIRNMLRDFLGEHQVQTQHTMPASTYLYLKLHLSPSRALC